MRIKSYIINSVNLKIPIYVNIFLLFVAFLILNYSDLVDEIPVIIPIFIFVNFLFFFNFQFSIGRLNPSQEIIFFSFIITSFCSELLYFGFPLFGQISYVDFGFPVVHHLTMMSWILILFGNNKVKYLLFNTLICLILFNRQFLLFGILAFLISYPKKISFGYKFLFLVIFSIVILSLGIWRNYVLGVDFSPFTNVISLPYIHYYDFILFYVVGPYNSSFGNLDLAFSDKIFSYWNTVPEWMYFSFLFKIKPAFSFVIFYSLVLFIVWLISIFFQKRRNYYIPIIYVFLFFTFFSSVLVSTVFLGVLLMLEFLFFVSRIKFVNDI